MTKEGAHALHWQAHHRGKAARHIFDEEGADALDGVGSSLVHGLVGTHVPADLGLR